MLRRIVRFSLFITLCVVGLNVLNPNSGRLYAALECDDSRNADAYFYSGGTITYQSYGESHGYASSIGLCNSEAQNSAIQQCHTACAGYAGGASGVAYCWVGWDWWWQGVHQGHVDQQYDCHDV
jgi:hypothetical protein